MTTPPPDPTVKLGPGTLKIGATGTEIDVSCLLNSATITASKDQGDSTTKLCGTEKPGVISYTYELGGNIDTDVASETGLFHLSVTEPGSVQAFQYVPNTAAGVQAAGELILDPLDFGGDEYGATLASDFTFALVTAPTYTWTTTP